MPEVGRPTLVLRDFGARRLGDRLRIDVDLRPGVNLLLGVNGIGKSAILTAVADPRARTRGSHAELRNRIVPGATGEPSLALLPQRPALPRGLTVDELLRYCCWIRGAEYAAIAPVVDAVDLSCLGGRRADRLSGGETQRVNLAIAFLGHPEVVLLDEPTVALDPVARAGFIRGLRRLLRPDTIVLLTTHLESDLEAADRVHVLGERGISWQGTVQGVLDLSEDGQLHTALARAAHPSTVLRP
ncbi:ATP-binding cassette domain-containing protein [Marmoricola sp. RAF53]|uniref:ATP-binding cassette domain-containing protein n=1 Tax=Marmoricola sp. RAF53 TaxID=3233059 RepID=UPI003F9B7DFE